MIDISKIPNFWVYENWDNYMANLWSFLINFRPFDVASTVMEIAPGAATKITKALAKLNFKGTYYIVEPHEDTSAKIYKKAEELLPNAKVILIQENFKNIKLNSKVDYLLANHPFDDFISAYASNDKNVLDMIFQDISDKKEVVVNLILQIWEKFNQHPELLSEIKKEIKNDFSKIVSDLSPKTIIMSQYPSAYYERNNLHKINTEALDLFENLGLIHYRTIEKNKIQELLNKNKDYELQWIIDILNARGWKIYEKI